MKHIKVFEDFTSTGSKKLREFTEGYLAYLLDDDIKIQIELGSEPDTYGLFIQRFGNGFKWNDIKDHFIPFLYMLIKEYDVEDRIRFGMVTYPLNRWLPHESYAIDKILTDDIDIFNFRKNSRRINTISIDLKEKK
jgi:hypothetical protein